MVSISVSKEARIKKKKFSFYNTNHKYLNKGVQEKCAFIKFTITITYLFNEISYLLSFY